MPLGTPRPTCPVCGTANRPLARWCAACGSRLDRPPPDTPLPTLDDLSPAERRVLEAHLDATGGRALTTVLLYATLGWAGAHRFAAGDQAGGLLRALAATFAAAFAFGLDVSGGGGAMLVPTVLLGALWGSNLPFLPSLVRGRRRRAELEARIAIWRGRRDAGRGPRARR